MPINPAAAAEVLARISKTPLSVMEVCGTHTVSIFRSGIRSLLPSTLRLVSGPGCPVCVTDQGEIEAALALLDQGAVVAAYGDMFKVPCEGGSLSSKRSRGLDARVVTSAMETLIDGRAQVSVSVTNVSGNSADASRVVTVTSNVSPAT